MLARSGPPSLEKGQGAVSNNIGVSTLLTVQASGCITMSLACKVDYHHISISYKIRFRRLLLRKTRLTLLLLKPVCRDSPNNLPHALAPPLYAQHAVSYLGQPRAVLERVGQEPMQVSYQSRTQSVIMTHDKLRTRSRLTSGNHAAKLPARLVTVRRPLRAAVAALPGVQPQAARHCPP